MTAASVTSKQLARRVETILEDLKGQSVNCINVRKLTTITDYMIIATGTSRIHAKSLANEVVEKISRSGHEVIGVEGLPGAEWVLVDLGAVVVHIMLAQVRALYDLEELWNLKPAGSS